MSNHFSSNFLTLQQKNREKKKDIIKIPSTLAKNTTLQVEAGPKQHALGPINQRLESGEHVL